MKKRKKRRSSLNGIRQRMTKSSLLDSTVQIGEILVGVILGSQVKKFVEKKDVVSGTDLLGLDGATSKFTTPLDITGADTRILPEKMELFPFSASTKIAWSKCTWVFDEESASSLLLSMIFSAQLKAQLATGTLLIDNNQVKTIDIAFSFLYKKI